MASKSRRGFDVEVADGVTIVRFADVILDEGDRAVIEDQVFDLVKKAERKDLRLDLAGVRFVSSAALGALIALNRKLRAIDGRLSLCNLNSETAEVIRATKLDTVLNIQK